MSELPPPSKSAVPQAVKPPESDDQPVLLVAAFIVAALLSIVAVVIVTGNDDEPSSTSPNIPLTVAEPDAVPTEPAATAAPPTATASEPSPSSTEPDVEQPPQTTIADADRADADGADGADADADADGGDADAAEAGEGDVDGGSQTATTEVEVVSTSPENDESAPENDESTPENDESTTAGSESPEQGEGGEAPNYPVLPDGSPVPIEVVYEGATVTLTGLVPSDEARQRFEVLAVAGAPQPDTEAVNLLEIEPTMPITVGARVLSLDSVRFPESSSEITPEHAAELDGVVRTLDALPNATMLVIGHSDQRGDDLDNLRLSRDRADAMVLYLATQGIDPSRLSSRAVGESNPISEENSEAALQLNRRTELIFYGLLID